MIGQHVIYRCDPWGRRVGELHGFETLQYTRVVNQRGFLVITWNWGAAPELNKDELVEVWRQPQGGTLRCMGVYLLRRFTWEVTENGRIKYAAAGPGTNDLLRRRIVAFAAGSPQGSKSGFAGNVMKGIVRENLGNLAGSARDLTGAGLSVAGDTHDGAWVTHKMARRRVLEALRAVADDSRERDAPVYFEVAPSSFDPIRLEFRTYPYQPGADRTAGGSELEVSPEIGNVKDARLEEDYTEELTTVYVGGSGRQAGRSVVTVSNGMESETPWARGEDFVDGGDTSDVAALTSTGKARLAEGRAQRQFKATLMDTSGTRFGREWGFGDRLVLWLFGRRLEVLVRSVQVSLSGEGEESVDGNLESVD